MGSPSDNESLAPAALQEVLVRAQRTGYIGQGALAGHLRHARHLYAQAPRDLPGGVWCDLGSGGGIPALVGIVDHPAMNWLLVEVARARADFLDWACHRLGVHDRVEIRAEPAETAGRSQYRQLGALVSARGFGGPSVTAECAAPLLAVGGVLLVAEPPGSDGSRWERLPGELGLALESVVSEPFAVAVLRQHAPCDERFPRRPGLPARRPLF